MYIKWNKLNFISQLNYLCVSALFLKFACETCRLLSTKILENYIPIYQHIYLCIHTIFTLDISIVANSGSSKVFRWCEMSKWCPCNLSTQFLPVIIHVFYGLFSKCIFSFIYDLFIFCIFSVYYYNVHISNYIRSSYLELLFVIILVRA